MVGNENVSKSLVEKLCAALVGDSAARSSLPQTIRQLLLESGISERPGGLIVNWAGRHPRRGSLDDVVQQVAARLWEDSGRDSWRESFSKDPVGAFRGVVTKAWDQLPRVGETGKGEGAAFDDSAHDRLSRMEAPRRESSLDPEQEIAAIEWPNDKFSLCRAFVEYVAMTRRDLISRSNLPPTHDDERGVVASAWDGAATEAGLSVARFRQAMWQELFEMAYSAPSSFRSLGQYLAIEMSRGVDDNQRSQDRGQPHQSADPKDLKFWQWVAQAAEWESNNQAASCFGGEARKVTVAATKQRSQAIAEESLDTGRTPFVDGSLLSRCANLAGHPTEGSFQALLALGRALGICQSTRDAEHPKNPGSGEKEPDTARALTALFYAAACGIPLGDLTYRKVAHYLAPSKLGSG